LPQGAPQRLFIHTQQNRIACSRFLSSLDHFPCMPEVVSRQLARTLTPKALTVAVRVDRHRHSGKVAKNKELKL